MTSERKAMYTAWDPNAQSWRIFPIPLSDVQNVEHGLLLQREDEDSWDDVIRRAAQRIRRNQTYREFSHRVTATSQQLFSAPNPIQEIEHEKGYYAKWAGAVGSTVAGVVTGVLSYFRITASGTVTCVQQLQDYAPETVLHITAEAYKIFQNSFNSTKITNLNYVDFFKNSTAMLVNQTLGIGFNYLQSELEKNESSSEDSNESLNSGILSMGLITATFLIIVGLNEKEKEPFMFHIQKSLGKQEEIKHVVKKLILTILDTESLLEILQPSVHSPR